jgi:hypothetical protein
MMIIEDNFIHSSVANEILKYSPPETASGIKSVHVRDLYEATKGYTVLCDLTKTEVSKEISKLQGDATVVDAVPDIFADLANKIGSKLSISTEHVFVQYIKVGKNGKVGKHYDVGLPGHVTYKCNICVDGPQNDVIYVGKEKFVINNYDLYCFEANLFKHWMDAREETRTHLSYGFLLPYESLGLDSDSPRARLSNRIFKAYFSKM